MRKLLATAAAFGLLFAVLNLAGHGAMQVPLQGSTVPSAPQSILSAADANTMVATYCTGCHNDATKDKYGNLSLKPFDVADAAGKNTEIAEKMIRKLRAGMMPPPGMRRPENDGLSALAGTLENIIDEAAAKNPNPGGRTFQRMNRTEYQYAIKDLLDLDVDAGSWLPLDEMSNNFDNIADAQTLSPTLMEGYLNAAAAISRMAVGDRNAPPIDVTYSNSQYVSQNPWDHVDGAPYGTRGGIVAKYVFPADGDFVFGVTFEDSFGVSPGDNTRLEDIDFSIDGARVALLAYDPSGGIGDSRGNAAMKTPPIHVHAGQQIVSAAFIRRTDGPYEDLIRPNDWSWAGGGSGGSGITALPHMRDLIITGPQKITGLSDTTSREIIFSCRPTSAKEERPCAEKIVSRLAEEAYRKSVSPADVAGLMQFYDTGTKKGGFELGVRTAIEGILASPRFVLRVERTPADVKPGQNYRISDIDLASRLSFFIWGTPPDSELQQIAEQGQLSKPGELEKQTRRLLADPRAEALGSRFAYQWFRLQDLDKNHPDPNYYPNFDQNIANLMKRETEEFFYNLVKENRSFLELLTADYTFVNERLARNYGIPNIAGEQFRMTKWPDSTRRGLLGQGSVLVLTSLANRTSPVLRGKWVMEVLLGTPPPPPPPNVPPLDDTKGAANGRLLTTRERMELHRANPTCNSCHKFMDPIGLALDNFDPTGRYRTRENGVALDTRGDFYDGTPVTNLSQLVDALMKRPIPLVRTFTENLMAYAIGRKVEYFDQPAIRAIVKDAESNNYRMESFILGVVKSDAFQMKRAVAKETTTAAGQQ